MPKKKTNTVFTSLHPDLEKLVRKRFDEPTPIQEAVIPEILAGRNVLSLSETGSGKTEACMLPVFSLWLHKPRKPISILYITPLRALNRNLMERVMWWSSQLDIDASVRHGDTTQHERRLQVENPPDMLISTPETLQAILTGKLMRENLRNIRYIIIDEVHELVPNKRGLQLAVGLERLKELIHMGGNPPPQVIALSATVGTPEKVAEFYNLGTPAKSDSGKTQKSAGTPAHSGPHNPESPADTPAQSDPGKTQKSAGTPAHSGPHNPESPADTPAQSGANSAQPVCSIINTVKTRKASLKVESPRPGKRDREAASLLKVSPDIAARLQMIRELIKSKRSTLSFTNTREFAEILSSRLKTLDPKLPVETHHSSLSKDVRVAAEDGFRSESIKSLICTSSLELGIDIGSIDLVLQYQSPRQVGKFLQRVGRSGHKLSKVSDGILIAGDQGDCFESSVIADLALKGWVEPTRPYGMSWDVLALQTLGLALEEYKIPAKKAHEIITRAQPFREVTYEEFMEVCMLLQKLRLIWVDIKYSETGEPLLKRRSRAFEHYYFNLSTIPDIRNYRVIDNLTNKHVGTLDAEFIALHGTPNTSFIVKGQAWRILDVGKTRVLVEPISGIEAAIPAWEGELIPVPYEIAQAVAALREEIAELQDSKPKAETIRALQRKYPITADVAKKLYSLVQTQLKSGFLPTRKRILIEHSSGEEGTWLIFHTSWGSLINDTVGRALSHTLTQRMGSVGLQTDPYRIMLRLQGLSDWKEALAAFRRMKPDELEKTILESLPGGELFNWRFIHVCKRFGIIRRDADFGKGYIRKIAEVYHGTPPYQEAINEALHDKLDLDGAKSVLESLQSGDLKLEIRRGLSPLGEAGVSRKYEILAPLKPEKEIFSIFRNRLLDTRLGLVCTNCGKWATITSARDVPERPHCPYCESMMVAVVPSKYLIEAQEIVKKRNSGKLTVEENGHLEYMLKSAALVSSSGGRAAVALAGRGVGPATAGRILSRMLKGDEFLQEILKAERNFAKTKRFWK